MLTTWGKKILSCYQTHVSPIISALTLSSSSPAMVEAKDIDGDTLYINPGPSNTNPTSFISEQLTSKSSSASYGIAIGSDGHQESENDYTLGNQVVGLQGTVAASTYFDTTNYKYISRRTVTLTNNGSDAVTIREIGEFIVSFKGTQRGSAPSTGNTNKCSIMINRTVLENPVVIPAGEAGVIMYDFVYDS